MDGPFMVNHISNFEIYNKIFIEIYHFQKLTYRK